MNFPFTDLSQTKLRPAIILWVDSIGKDIVVCAITSQNTNRLDEGEFLLDIADPEFSQTGLRVSSKVRVTRLATLDRQFAVKKLGHLSNQQIHQLNTQIIQSFQLNGYQLNAEL